MKHKMDENMRHEPAHMYRHEEEMPKVPAHGHQMSGMGCCDMKGEAAEIAYGMAGPAGVKSDEKKMNAQFRNYHWDGGASGY